MVPLLTLYVSYAMKRLDGAQETPLVAALPHSSLDAMHTISTSNHMGKCQTVTYHESHYPDLPSSINHMPFGCTQAGNPQ